MKLNIKLIFIGLALLSVLLAGCAKQTDTQNEQLVGADCGTVTPGYNDECCANKNVETPRVMCVGSWKYVGGEEECTYVCDAEQPAVQGNTAGLIDKDYCETDDDCACGISVETADCYFGNRDYIQDGTFELATDPGLCADYCYGEIGNLEIKCVQNKCVQQ